MLATKDRKASIFSVAIVFFTFIVFASLFVVLIQNHDKLRVPIGYEQTQILQTAQRAEKQLFFIDKSADLAVDSAIHSLAERGGFSSKSECGEYIGYNLWNTKGRQCYPENMSLKLADMLSSELQTYLSGYVMDVLPLNYGISVQKSQGVKSDTGHDTGLDITGTAVSPIYLTKHPVGMGVGVPSDPDDIGQKITACKDGDCVVDLAEEYRDQYWQLPYVWGGESPYSYEATISDQKQNPDSVFKGVSVTEYQPSGNKIRSGKPTIPGFDCSGFVWWVMKHGGILEPRLTAAGYHEYAKDKRWQPVCVRSTCTKDKIKEDARPGDIMFIHPCESRGVCHIGIYAGDDGIVKSNMEIIESIGSDGIVKREIPERYYHGGSIGMEAIYRPKYAGITQPKQVSQQKDITQPTVSAQFDAPIEGDALIYSLTPSFRIHKDYDLEGDYKTLRQEARWLIDKTLECENNIDKKASYTVNTVLDCIKKNIKQTHLSMECSKDPLLDMYDDFAGQFIKCAEPETEQKGGCACEITPKFREEYKGRQLMLTISGNGTDIIISTKAAGLTNQKEYRIKNKQLQTVEYMNGMLEFFPKDEIRLYLRFDSDSLDVLKINDKDFGDRLYLYHIGSGFAIMTESEYKKSAMDDCVIQPERVFRFCSQGANKERFARIDELGLSYDLERPVYRFALSFVDQDAPTLIKDFTVGDLKLAEGKLLLKFTRPLFNNKPISDIDHYNIYCSAKDFTSTEGMTPSRKIRTNNTVIFAMIDNCNNLDINDSSKYYFTVSAVDKSGNELREGVRAVSGESIDDLPPREARVTGVSADSEEGLVVAWVEIDKNYDLSELKDLEYYHIYYGSVMLGSASYSDSTTTITLPSGTDTGVYTIDSVKVLGADEVPNIIENTNKDFKDAFKEKNGGVEII